VYGIEGNIAADTKIQRVRNDESRATIASAEDRSRAVARIEGFDLKVGVTGIRPLPRKYLARILSGKIEVGQRKRLTN